jgi:hypothetical protein
MKPRSVLLLALLIVVAAGAVVVISGFNQPQVTQISSPAIQLPVLPVLSGHAGTPSETARRIARAADFQDPAVKNFVAAHSPNGGGAPSIAEVSNLWEGISADWTFVRGPPDSSNYTPASVSLADGMEGNCLDFSILNAAVIASLGGTARVVIAYNPEEGGHAYPELYIGDSIRDLQSAGTYIAGRYNATTMHWHTTTGPFGRTEYWLNLDWQAKYPGGPFFADNGTYYASYLTGNGERFFDNGTLVTETR